MKQIKLFAFKGWDVVILSDFKLDLDFYDDFKVAISIRSEGRSVSGGWTYGTLTRTKYPLSIEILNRRIFCLRFIKEMKVGTVAKWYNSFGEAIYLNKEEFELVSKTLHYKQIKSEEGLNTYQSMESA